MTIKQFFLRFNELYKTYLLGENNCCKIKIKSWCFIDYSLAFLFQGASLNDYFAYGFYKLRPNGRKEFITFRRHRKIQKKCNDSNFIKWFRDKSLFNEKFARYLHRDYLDINNTNEKEFTEFYDKHKVLFVKDVSGYRAKGIVRCSINEGSASELWHRLKADDRSHYIVEAEIKERDEVASFHPSSVNTLRIVTVYDDKHDKVNVMGARLRMGNKGYSFDNFHYDGICANIDLESGIITSVGYDKNDREYIVHPFSGKQIVGAYIPDWDKCKAFCEKISRVVPEVRYVGWDIVPLENGEFALIEGNDNADHDLQQLHYHGMWPEYETILKQLK